MTATNTTIPSDAVTLEKASGAPPIYVHAIAVAAAALPILLAIFWPGHTSLTPGFEALLVIVGVVAFLVVHLVHLIGVNGISKAGLSKTVTEEEVWIKANYPTLKATFEDAKPALDALPGVPKALEEAQSRLGQLEKAVPTVDQQAVEAAAKSVVSDIFGGHSVVTTGGVITVPAAPVAQPAQATPSTPLPASSPPPAASPTTLPSTVAPA